MALLKELSESNIDSLCSWFEKKHFIKQSFWNPNWALLTRFRFIHYYIAHQLLTIFEREFNQKMSVLDESAISIQFGLENPDDLLTQLIIEKHFGLIEIGCFENIEPDTFSHHEISVGDDSIASEQINAQLLQLFSERHLNEEMQARSELMTPVKHYLKDHDTIHEIAYRLRKGYSLSALEKYAAPLEKSIA